MVPGGRLGAAGWHAAAPVVGRLIDRALDRMREIVEAEQSGTTQDGAGDQNP